MNTEMMPAGREIDALVAEKVLGQWVSQDRLYADHKPIPPYSTDIAAAWLVVERMRQYIGDEDNDRWGDFTDVLNEAYDYRISALMGELTPLAICRAALKAFA